MTNTNCLVGMKCPKCGSYEPFWIVVASMALMSDDGTDEIKDTEWNQSSYCKCWHCEFEGEVKDFK